MMEENYIKDLYKYISDTPRLVSLLYDINRLPEQTMNDQKLHMETLIIAEAWKENENKKT